MPAGAIDWIVREHVEEAAFLWRLRKRAVTAPHYTLDDLVELDLRCEAHLDGIRVAGDFGRQTALEALAEEEMGGEAFVATVTSLIAKNSSGLKQVLEADRPDNLAEFISALGWVGWDIAAPVLRSSIEHESQTRRRVGIGGFATQRQDPGERLQREIEGEHSTLARSLRAAGELRRRDCLARVQDRFHSADEAIRFWAAWSGILLGDDSAAAPLEAAINFNSSFAYQAIQLVSRVKPLTVSQRWLRGLASQRATRRLALIGCGVVGDPIYVPTLIGQMAEPEQARIAGEAFSMITGVDLAYENLDTEPPDDFETGPTEDPTDDDVTLDPDEDLAWPNHSLVQSWWEANGDRFQTGSRYLCGGLISEPNCQRVLREGYQRQRIAAAYELALMNPTEPLFEWRAPGWRQQALLGLKPAFRGYSAGS